MTTRVGYGGGKNTQKVVQCEKKQDIKYVGGPPAVAGSGGGERGQEVGDWD